MVKWLIAARLTCNVQGPGTIGIYSSPLPQLVYLSCRLSVMIRSLLICNASKFIPEEPHVARGQNTLGLVSET